MHSRCALTIIRLTSHLPPPLLSYRRGLGAFPKKEDPLAPFPSNRGSGSAPVAHEAVGRAAFVARAHKADSQSCQNCRFRRTNHQLHNMSATFANCDTSAIIQPASKRGKHACEDSVWKAGARLSSAWMKDGSSYNAALGTRCANNACMLAYLLDIFDDNNADNHEIVKSMPPRALLKLWFASKGCATSYFCKEKCPFTGNKLQVLPHVTENAKTNGVMVATLAESATPDGWAAQINGFVNEATEGKITELVSAEMVAETTSVLVAAEIIKRVFAGGYTFDESLTEENAVFHNLDGSRGTCHLMLHEKRACSMPHLKLASGDLVLIPTSEKKGGPQDTAFMAIFLPNAAAGDTNKTDVDALHAATDEIAAHMQGIDDLVRSPM